MTAWDRHNGATNHQPAPNFLYYNLTFGAGEYRKILYHRTDQGFGYLLRYYTLATYEVTTLLAGVFPLGNLPQIEFYVRRQSRQSDPIPVGLESSPAGEGYNDMAAYPLLNASVLKSHKLLNYFFQFGDTLEAHMVRDPNVRDTQGLPIAYACHLVLKGYDVPEPQARIW